MKFKEAMLKILEGMPEADDQELIFEPVAGMFLLVGPNNANPAEGTMASYIRCDPLNQEAFRGAVMEVIKQRLSGAALDSTQKRLN